jgi:hypothetical protein
MEYSAPIFISFYEGLILNGIFFKGALMLLAACIFLAILWLAGIMTGYTLSGFIHILLAAAIVVLIIRMFHKGNSHDISGQG